MAGERETDVVIVGAALAGLVAGAILTRHGKRVVLLDQADTVGGRGGAVERPGGWWIDFGHRDGHDVGDCQAMWHHGAEAAREAGVEIALRPVEAPLRLHRFPEGTVLEGGAWGPEAFLATARDFFECPDDAVEELAATVRRLAAATPAEIEAAIPERLGAWLPAHVHHPGARRALLLMATVIFHPHPEEASVGRLMQFFQTPRRGPFIPDDDQAGGMQGLMEPWARAIRASGRPEHHAGWNRLLWGPERVYRGGWQITSMTSRRAAPPGKHLLSLVMARFFRGGSTAGQPWSAARQQLDQAIAYLRRFYADLDDCLEWSAYQYVAAPQTMSWAWAPVRRHALTVPTIRGLLLAGSTLEAPAAIIDLAAYAGPEAARRALAGGRRA